MFLKGLKYSMIAAAVALALTGCDEEKKETVAPAATQQQAPKAQQKAETKDVKADDAKAESKDFGSLEKNASYAIGSMIGTDLKNNFVEANKKLEIAVDPELIKAGFIDGKNLKSSLNCLKRKLKNRQLRRAQKTYRKVRTSWLRMQRMRT